MFLQYAVWGAWVPLLQAFLMEHRHLSSEEFGWIGGFGAIGAVTAPFVMGQLADRHVALEKLVGVSHLIGAVLVWQMSSLTSFGSLLAFAILYSLVYAPTMPLTNALAFHHLPDRIRDFGKVRIWGSIGWIAVGIGMGHWLLNRHTPTGSDVTAEAVRAAQVAGMGDAFRLSAILGAVLGVFSFTLPHTPPRRGAEKFAPFEALREVRKQPLLALFLLSIPVSCLHQYFMLYAAGYLGHLKIQSSAIDEIFGVGGGGVMTIGQISEVFFLALVPVIARRVSRKSLLAVGLACYAARFAAFAYFPRPEVILPALALHGPIFGFFIFLAFMIVDEETTADVRSSAQGLYNLVIVGMGVVVGSVLSGTIGSWFEKPDHTFDYERLFALPMWVSLACLVLLLLFYPARKTAPAAATA